MAIEFESAFLSLTGYAPLRWQTRLHEDYFRSGGLPTSVSIPTGLGKTATMAIWLIALAQQMKYDGKPVLPRRLVYVVDRHAVVDQATRFAETLRENLAKANGLAAALGLVESESLPISTLRGQFVDNREWLEDPSRPAIIIGTVDMIGSRLLFEGYGVSRKMRPYHAGLMGADVLVLLDEAHLVPPFESLLAEIAENAGCYGAKEADLNALVPEFHLLPLSATGRSQGATSFVLEEKDFRNPDDAITIERLSAKKQLTLHDLGNKKLGEAMAEQAWALAKDTQNGENALKPVRIIVYCNSRDAAEKIKEELDKKAKKTLAEGRTELFVGARRVRERQNVQKRLEELCFLAGDLEQNKPAFLVATSAGEVGVDLDADHMVCDLVAWERMVQRFGRVNRRGGKDRKAEIVIVHSSPKVPKTKKPEDLKLEKLEEPKFEKEEPIDPGKPSGKPSKKASDVEKSAYEEEKAKLDKFKNAKKKYNNEKKKYKAAKKIFEKKRKEQEINQQEYVKSLAVYQKDWAETFLYRDRIEVLEKLQGNASPDVLRNLAINDELKSLIEKCSSPPPLRPALNRPLVDAWSMTSLPEHTGRPRVDPWLRGWVDDPPQTTVVWRKYLPVRERPAVGKKEIEDYFEAAPVHASEELETESYRVMKWLKARTEKLNKIPDNEKELRAGDVFAVLLGVDGKFVRALCLRDLLGDSKEDKKRLEEIAGNLPGKTLVMDARFGGMQDGLLKDEANDVPTIADDNSQWLAPIDMKPVIRFRILGHPDEDNGNEDDGWSENLRFDLERNADGEATRWLSIQKWRDTSNTEDDRSEGHPQALSDHQCRAVKRLRTIGGRLGLPDCYINMLCIAARLHDEGKKAKRWQRAFRAERDAKKYSIQGPLAKTRGPINQAVLDGYRHEFGSLLHAKEDTEFKKLPEELQDLALHLIAAHHGFARPLIATRGCEDAPPSVLEERAREVALRFARLQKRWGPWGLAWWEALLRAADVQASRDNEMLDNHQNKRNN